MKFKYLALGFNIRSIWLCNFRYLTLVVQALYLQPEAPGIPPSRVSKRNLSIQQEVLPAKKIVLSFNEFIQLDNIQQNLLVSPTPKINPTIESKLRTITINIKDTLEENTTYAFDFGKSIKDVNEGNVLKLYLHFFYRKKY